MSRAPTVPVGRSRDADGRLQTFLFADLAGYTALTEAHGDEHAADIAERFCALVRALLDAHGAEELNLIGDALLLRIPSTGSAVKLAGQIVSDHGRHNGLGVRVGMHTGSAVQRGRDWFGSGINIAARIAGAAGPGEVLLSQRTRNELPTTVRTRPRGFQVFKNVAHPVEVHELVLSNDQTTRSMRVDPVCRMAVDPALARGSLTHRGVKHHFCSTNCIETFRAFPALYAPLPPPTPDRYVPAAGRPALTGAYDLMMALTMRERHWRPALIRAVTLDLPQHGTIVELGCGTGSNAITIALERPDASVIAIDGDPNALEIARRKPGAERVRWAHQLATEPIPTSAPVDVALCSLLLHHLNDVDKRQALTGLARALRPEGVLHIADWGPPRGHRSRLGTRALQLLDGRDGPASLIAGQLPTLLEHAGFSQVHRAASLATAWGPLERWYARPNA